MAQPYFAAEEYGARLAALRVGMAARGIELALLSAPENIFYLTGLDHWGYFAPHILMVPAEGELVLATRAMEKVTVANQVANARFEGHGDQETVADAVGRALRDVREKPSRIGIEAWSSGLPQGLAAALQRQMPRADWIDLTGLVDGLRMVKSEVERAYMREAARISDAGAAAAIEAIGPGASERHVAAECERAMIEAGGTFPGFGPFIRSIARLGEEHTSWSDTRLRPGESVFLELTGCVARYHAPLGRLIHIGRAPPDAHEMADLARAAFDAVLDSLCEGALFRDVYAAWQGVVDRAGLSHYRRHHCGYMVGIGFPPSWTGGNKVTGLRADSDIPVRIGMSFHVLSWLMGTGRGDYFISNTVLLGEEGPEVLTRTPMQVTAR
ncbi:Xaa-Pro aminopeptidase [Hypericibacter terrae]|uniref:Xaa-Pro aminopeptidase n=1 Tax=Hypericibacter terrae TaxID=2602015 RepID=A0A5J6MCA1_9PROT|nr:Xaa-Pro peptidase family protein [Hypericibacter terrae]QEX14812.1 Xaa-Pro aminopeptidase [Hypericibacter terrae]